MLHVCRASCVPTEQSMLSKDPDLAPLNSRSLWLGNLLPAKLFGAFSRSQSGGRFERTVFLVHLHKKMSVPIGLVSGLFVDINPISDGLPSFAEQLRHLLRSTPPPAIANLYLVEGASWL